jgi:O-antigen/teichoic acid export membrane protein
MSASQMRENMRARTSDWTLGRLLLAKGAGNFALNLIALVAGFVIALLLSRTLGSSGYGAYAFSIALGTFLAVPVLLGLPTLVIREVASDRVRARWGLIRGVIRWSNQLVLLASVVVCGLAAATFAATGWPSGSLRVPAFIGLAFVPLTGVVSLRTAAMQGFGRVVQGRLPENLVTPILTIAGVVALDLVLGDRFSASWAVSAALVALVVGVILGIWLLRLSTPAEVRAARPELAPRRWLLAALPIFVISGISTVNDQAGTLVLGAVSTPREVGVFGVAYRVANLIPFLLLVAIPTLMPSIAELNATGETKRLQTLMTRTARIVFYGSLPVAIVVLVAAGPLLELFGADFSSGTTALRIMAVGQIVNVAVGVPGTILMMVHEAGRMTIGIGLGALANVGLTVALAPKFGATGAAVANCASVTLTNLFLAGALWRSKRIWSPAVALPH